MVELTRDGYDGMEKGATIETAPNSAEMEASRLSVYDHTQGL